MPRGGARVGSGRKPKTALEKALTGNPGHRGRVLCGPGAGEAPISTPLEPFDPPEGMGSEERKVWDTLAPHAFAARTLTRATAVAFELLCRNVVLERLYGSSRRDWGGANHRGIIQRVDHELSAFNLRPFGKPMVEAEPMKPANPLDKFLNRQRG